MFDYSIGNDCNIWQSSQLKLVHKQEKWKKKKKPSYWHNLNTSAPDEVRIMQMTRIVPAHDPRLSCKSSDHDDKYCGGEAGRCLHLQ